MFGSVSIYSFYGLTNLLFPFILALALSSEALPVFLVPITTLTKIWSVQLPQWVVKSFCI